MDRIEFEVRQHMAPETSGSYGWKFLRDILGVYAQLGGCPCHKREKAYRCTTVYQKSHTRGRTLRDQRQRSGQMGEALSRDGKLRGQGVWRQHLATGGVRGFPAHAYYEQPDLTLDEIITIMRKYKITGKCTSVWRFFQRHRPRNDAPGLIVASIICIVARRRSTRS
jgi:hypothetical protein